MMQVAMIWAGTLLAVTVILAGAALAAWRGWLDLRRQQLATDRPAEEPPTGVRIEMAALKERLRKLEAIAQGVDL